MSDTNIFYYHTSSTGARIFVEECGTGPLMILMHGLGGSTNSFQPLIRHFLSKYAMLRFDFPGSGLSKLSPTLQPLSIPKFVEDLESIISAKGSAGEFPILVGHSLGSVVAMHYAAKHPNIRALVILGPGKSGAHIPAVAERMLGMAAKARTAIEDMRDSTVANNVAASSSDLVRTVIRQMISAQDAEGYAATCEAIVASSHVNPNYAAINCPTVLIAGDVDMISPLSRSYDLEKLIGSERDQKRVSVKVVHAAHQQVLEDTEGVIEVMESLLATL
jgi:3-oxoadipate enol-lactonase